MLPAPAPISFFRLTRRMRNSNSTTLAPTNYQVLCADENGNPLPGQGARMMNDPSSFPHDLAYSTCIDPGSHYIQRRIYSSGGSIYVNGRLLAEPYLPHDDPLGPPIPDASSQRPYRVPPGEFYMLGDNRAISCDSRYWGPIKGSSIIGKVGLVWWHDDHPDFRRF